MPVGRRHRRLLIVGRLIVIGHPLRSRRAVARRRCRRRRAERRRRSENPCAPPLRRLPSSRQVPDAISPGVSGRGRSDKFSRSRVIGPRRSPVVATPSIVRYPCRAKSEKFGFRSKYLKGRRLLARRLAPIRKYSLLSSFLAKHLLYYRVGHGFVGGSDASGHFQSHHASGLHVILLRASCIT